MSSASSSVRFMKSARPSVNKVLQQSNTAIDVHKGFAIAMICFLINQCFCLPVMLLSYEFFASMMAHLSPLSLSSTNEVQLFLSVIKDVDLLRGHGMDSHRLS